MDEPLDELLEPYDGMVTPSWNETELSRICNSLVITFLNYNATSARVHIEKINYPLDELYQAMWSVCRKKMFKGKVKVKRQSGMLFLVRVGE